MFSGSFSMSSIRRSLLALALLTGTAGAAHAAEDPLAD
jgi:hypothetical protein